MLIKWTKKKGRLALFFVLLGLAFIAVAHLTKPYCICSPCAFMFTDGKIVYPPCRGTSNANHLFQTVFGHNDRHSEAMTKSTGPCVAKSSLH
jgi:hypothetical protein